jgi:hypothetical protein
VAAIEAASSDVPDVAHQVEEQLERRHRAALAPRPHGRGEDGLHARVTWTPSSATRDGPSRSRSCGIAAIVLRRQLRLGWCVQRLKAVPIR